MALTSEQFEELKKFVLKWKPFKETDPDYDVMYYDDDFDHGNRAFATVIVKLLKEEGAWNEELEKQFTVINNVDENQV